MILGTLLIVAAKLFIGAAIIMAVLTFGDVLGWFRSRLSERGATKLDGLKAFTIQELMASGNYQTVQGLWDDTTSNIVEHRVVNSQGIDQQLKDVHKTNRLAVYE